jgi:hypothetical protein
MDERNVRFLANNYHETSLRKSIYLPLRSCRRSADVKITGVLVSTGKISKSNELAVEMLSDRFVHPSYGNVSVLSYRLRDD